MDPVDGESSDDDVYDWFVQSLVEAYGSAHEVEPGVIRVVDRSGDTTPAEPRTFDLLITRAQLRSVAWAAVDIFDDSQGDVDVPASNPVLAGLDQFSFFTQERIDTSRPEERYLVFDRGRMHPSVRPELPPVRGRPEELDVPAGGGMWYAHRRDGGPPDRYIDPDLQGPVEET